MSAKHEKTKRILRIIGAVMLVIGVVCDIIGFIDFFSAFNGDDMPTKFYLFMIGFPLTGIGLMLLLISFHREMARYVKDETVPVINEAGQEISPAVRAVANAVKHSDAKYCPHCGSENPAENGYCRACGKSLAKVCPHCGATAPADSAFCGKCGGKL